jgi:hypothetical protein
MSIDQCRSSCCGSGKKEKTVGDQRLSEFKNSNFFGSDIASSSAKEPKEKKQKINKKHSDGRTIVVRAFDRRGEEIHVAEAEITLDSDGAFAVDYVAAKLLLNGNLYVSDMPFCSSKNTHSTQIIHPRNHYLYEPVSSHIVSWDEIKELQDFSGVLMVTFNKAYSKTQRARRNTVEFMC